ncbi:MAG TPA: hypothetical protein VMJ34_02885 [Bryobacteraceae bacterium]|nr:hypothetical protein [Bryobacteraceae bacterium]
MGGFWTGLKRFLLWDFPRAGWQYDVMVAIILLFIFVTPREWFRDQPKASSVVMLPAEHGHRQAFWIAPEMLAGVEPARQTATVENLLKARWQRPFHVVVLRPIPDSEQEIRGWLAYVANP